MTFRTTITLVYYGLSLSSVELSGNKYLNFMLVNAVEIPAFLTSWYFMERFPRRKTQAFSFLASGVGCILVNVISKRKPTYRSFCFKFISFRSRHVSSIRIKLLYLCSRLCVAFYRYIVFQ